MPWLLASLIEVYQQDDLGYAAEGAHQARVAVVGNGAGQKGDEGRASRHLSAKQGTSPRSAAARAAVFIKSSSPRIVAKLDALKQTECARNEAHVSIYNHSALRRAQSLLLKISTSTIVFRQRATSDPRGHQISIEPMEEET